MQMERKASYARSTLEQMLVNETAHPKALPLSLLEDITGDFSEDQEIGRGGFAVVYKGILGDMAVAVKRLSNAFMDEKEFHREVECLMRVKHKNVVRFLGYCADRQGNMERYDGKLVMADVHQRLLCFEYILEGSLDKYIINPYRQWGTCYKIIKGICEGVQYLHENNIIHLDLKPANILLSNNMVPKITDFGLSRCFEENQSRHITKNILGTIGYLAPEVRVGGVVARSADLYSLGVIIIEILTGQKGYQAIDDVLESWSNRLQRSKRDTLCEQIRVCYEIALDCIDFNPKKRPASARDIIDLLHEMESIQSEKFGGTLTTYTNTSSTSTREGRFDGNRNQATVKHVDDSDGAERTGATELTNIAQGDAVWVPPEDEAKNLGAYTNYDNDECHDGVNGGPPRTSDSNPCPSLREERHATMLRAMDRHLKMLIGRFLASTGISLPREDDVGKGWLDIITSLSWEAVLLINPDGKAGNEMDPMSYIKVKRVASGTRQQCEVIKGLVFRKKAAHKHMPTKCHNPKLLLLRGTLGDSDVGLASFDSMVQEHDHLKSAIRQVMEMCAPDVIMVEKTVLRDIQDRLLLYQSVTLVLDMKLNRLQRIARCSGSPIVSVSEILGAPKLKQCDYLHIEKVMEEHNNDDEGWKRPSKTLMFLEGFPKPYGCTCTILLRGANSEELKKVKQVMLYTVPAAYDLVLETSFFEDQRVFLNDRNVRSIIGFKDRDKENEMV